MTEDVGFYKNINGDYMDFLSKGYGQERISEAEYNEILSIIRNKPVATKTTDYRLKADLTWEEYEIDPPDPDPELNETELLNILLGEGFEI